MLDSGSMIVSDKAEYQDDREVHSDRVNLIDLSIKLDAMKLGWFNIKPICTNGLFILI